MGTLGAQGSSGLPETVDILGSQGRSEPLLGFEDISKRGAITNVYIKQTDIFKIMQKIIIFGDFSIFSN